MAEPVSLPPPSDLDAEASVIRGVLDGQIKAAETGLPPALFFAPLHRATWACLLSLEELPPASKRRIRETGSALPWLARLVGELGRSSGFSGATAQDAFEYLHKLRREMPVQPIWDVWRSGRRIVELAHHRELLEAMARIDAALRAGEPPDPAVVEVAARRLEELGGSG